MVGNPADRFGGTGPSHRHRYPLHYVVLIVRHLKESKPAERSGSYVELSEDGNSHKGLKI